MSPSKRTGSGLAGFTWSRRERVQTGLACLQPPSQARYMRWVFGLYAIVDVEALARRGLDPVRFAEAVIAARPAAVQLRDKRRDAAATLATLRALAALASAAAVPLFANDRVDLALLARCDGVHVGQDDVPPALVRTLAPTLRVGLSTHDEIQLERALAEPIDYVAIGPVFATASKERPAPVLGVARFAELAARVRARRPGLPVVAIGGIERDRARELAGHADACAVILALLPTRESGDCYDEVAARAAALSAALKPDGQKGAA